MKKGRHVLVIRFSSIGDIVLTTPIIRCLKQQKGYEIDFLTKHEFADLLAPNPYLSNIITIQQSIDEVLFSIRQNSYDLIIDLHSSIRSKLLTRKLGVRTITYDKQRIRKWLFLKTGIKAFEDKHVVHQYFDPLKQIGISPDGKGLDFFTDDTVGSPSKPNRKKHIAIVAGGTYITKRIPSAVISAIIKNTEYSFHLLGGADVDQKIQNLQGKTIHNHINKTSVQEAAAIIKQCDLVVTGDTGLMHIAAAMQKKIITIWGSTSAEFGFYPYYGSQSKTKYESFFNADISCRPCSKYGISSCPKKHMNCLNNLNINILNQLILKQLQA